MGKNVELLTAADLYHRAAFWLSVLESSVTGKERERIYSGKWIGFDTSVLTQVFYLALPRNLAKLKRLGYKPLSYIEDILERYVDMIVEFTKSGKSKNLSNLSWASYNISICYIAYDLGVHPSEFDPIFEQLEEEL